MWIICNLSEALNRHYDIRDYDVSTLFRCMSFRCLHGRDIVYNICWFILLCLATFWLVAWFVRVIVNILSFLWHVGEVGA